MKDKSIDKDSDKPQEAMNQMYSLQVGLCLTAIQQLRSVDLADKNIIIRAIMRDMPACDIGCRSAAEDCAVDLWVDRAEYIDLDSFDLYVTQAEENVLWNSEKKGQKPGRLDVPQQRITVRADGMNTPPFIPLVYLTILTTKLLAMAFSNRTDAELSNYEDESVMSGMIDPLVTILESMMDGTPDADDKAKHPVS